MEPWQRTHITRSLHDLVKNTICDTDLLTQLQAKEILGDSDVLAIQAERHPHTQSKLFYDIIQTKTGGYEALIDALVDLRKSGALAILQKFEFSVEILHGIRFIIFGLEKTLEEILSKDEILALVEQLQTDMTSLQIFQFLRWAKNAAKDDPIPILKETIPDELPFHVSRVLVRTGDNTHVSEKELVKILESSGTGVQILGQPGNGKTTLLAKVAKKLAMQNTDKMVIFVDLHGFINSIDRREILASPETVLKLLVKHTSPTSITQAILFRFLQSNNNRVTMEVFFDGLENIHNPDDRQWINVFIQLSMGLKNARCHFAGKANDHGSFLKYEILQLSYNNQIDLIAAAWKMNQIYSVEPQNLRELAEQKLTSIVQNLNENEIQMFGIPVLCYLIAKTFQPDEKYTRIPQSAYDLLKMFKAKFSNHTDNAFLNSLQVLHPSTEKQYRILFKLISVSADSRRLSRNPFLFHSCIPEYVIAEKLISNISSNILAPQLSDEYFRIIVLPLFVYMMTHKNSGYNRPTSIFQGVQQQSYETYTFTNPIAIYLFRKILEENSNIQIDKGFLQSFCTDVTPALLYRVVMSAVSNEHIDIIKLLNHVLADLNDTQKQEYKDYFQDSNRGLHLLLQATETGNQTVLNETLQMFQNSLKYDIKTALQNAPPNHLCPLHIAINAGSIELVEYIMVHMYARKAEHLSFGLVYMTHTDSDLALKKKLKILNFVAKQNREILRFFLQYMPSLHLDVFKCLFDAGCDLSLGDYYDYTIAHHMATTNSSEFHKLANFLINYCNLGSMFNNCKPKGFTPLHIACYQMENLQTETVEMIASVKAFNINLVNWDGNSMFMLACEKNKKGTRSLLETLARLGARCDIHNNKDRNALHIAVLGCNQEAVEYLMQFHDRLNTRDVDGKQPKDLAQNKIRFLAQNGLTTGTVVEAYHKILNLLQNCL